MYNNQPYAPQQAYGGPPQGQQADYYNQQSNYPPPNGNGNGNPNGNNYYGGDQKMALAPNGYEGERFSPKKPKFNE